jgi:peptidoglycan/LPS O-acetylase OafA/YrhL
VGVDVFFVVSGFLITGLLLREKERTGRISLRGFYLRRVKRILPAAALVLVSTVVLSHLVFSSIRATSVLVDSLWASVFAANWHFIAIGTDYMNASDATSPLQHYWSLSVEEQFYLVWPLLMLAVLAVGKGRPRVAVGVTLASITVISFVWALWETSTNPTWSYFSTTSRTWELSIGAVLACIAPRLQSIPASVRPWMSWVGLATLAVCVLTFTSTTAFPGPWAAVPVLATVLILAAGTGGEVRYLAPLTNRASVYLGAISYSLYLWHLPVITFVEVYLPQQGTKYLLLATALMLVLSVLSYHWVEDPLRKASWAIGPRARRLTRDAPGSAEKRTERRSRPLASRLALPSLLLVATLLMGATYANRLPEPVAPAQAVTIPLTQLLTSPPASEAQAERTEAIADALDDTEWPELTPKISELGDDSRASEWTQDGCLGLESLEDGTPEEIALDCVYGNPKATKTIALLGDSQGISYAPALRAAIDDGWNVRVFTMSQCPWVDVAVVKGDGATHPECAAFRDWSVKQILALQPDRVVLTSAAAAIINLASGNTGATANQEWAKGIRVTLSQLSGLDTVILDAPPETESLVECAVRGATPADCVRTPQPVFIEGGSLIRDIAAEFPDVSVPPTFEWFCSPEGLCPSYIDGVPTMADAGHLSDAAASTLGPLVAEALRL